MYVHNDPKLKEKRRELRRNQTEVEKMLWKQLRNKQFYGIKFYRQYSMGVYILDFYCPKFSFAIELDGGQHAEIKSQKHDEIRSRYLRGLGIKVLRFWNIDVIQNMEGVLQKITEQITPPNLPLI